MEKSAFKLYYVLSIAALRFHYLVAASGRLCDFKTQLKYFATTWAGLYGHFAASEISTFLKGFCEGTKRLCFIEGIVEDVSASSSFSGESSQNLSQM